MSEKDYLKLIIGKDSQDEDKGYKARTPNLEDDVEKILKKPLKSIKSQNEQILDFASNHDIPYRLKRTENHLILYGLNFGFSLYNLLHNSISSQIDPTILPPNHFTEELFKNIINTEEANLHQDLVTAIETNLNKDPSFLDNYRTLVRPETLHNEVDEQFRNYSIKNKEFSYSQNTINKIVSDNHLRNIFKAEFE